MSPKPGTVSSHYNWSRIVVSVATETLEKGNWNWKNRHCEDDGDGGLHDVEGPKEAHGRRQGVHGRPDALHRAHPAA